MASGDNLVGKVFDAQTGGPDFESPVPLQKPVHSSEHLYIVLAHVHGGRKIPGAFHPCCLAYQHDPGLVRDSQKPGLEKLQL